MYVTGRLVLLTALGVVPVLLLSAAGVSPWAAAGGWALLCAAAALADVAGAADPRRLRIERRLPGRARRDEPAETELRVRNDGGRTLVGLLRDAWQPTAGAPADRQPLAVPAGEARTVRVPLRPRRRGEVRSEFVVIRSIGCLGLAGRQAVIAAPGAIRVLPPFTARRHLPSRLARLRELDGSTSVQVRGAGTEFDSLREYVRGDDVRSIDWRATARSGTTMLRTWRPERDRHVVIVVDTGRTAATRVGDGVRLDAGMEAALLLGALAAAAGDHVHLLMFDRAVRARVTGADGSALLPAMVEAMAPVNARLIDTDWDAALAQARRITRRPALLVLLTAQDSPDAARGFLSALAGVASRTRVLVATATDADPRPVGVRPSAADAYLAASLERGRQDAAAVRRAIGRAGAVAVTADAETLPPRVADHYLYLKARGRL
ncbi:DUF58 domain-containing protein [Microbacterium sp. SORGH_AS_0888]|uniref:DUF58 domain-containing protein n=1 Tax=Microbacterium sp. SORGH_AS_0888 TaxID=3041791 RepID=UPI00278BA388|nr:DUF58 domain-containing protein [Microbacterium sp. SORGH_AS_0888]MDQ1127915.1 uncharacterized protein (DUF58 family) [Microbacterium sp. SORGH_AS_0888]